MELQTAAMVNSSLTLLSSFVLGMYVHVGSWRYLCFLLLLSFYAAIVCSNVLLIVVICVNRNLHEPMYLLLRSLFVNELYGSTGLFPFLMLQVLSDVHTVSAPCCFLQIFCLYSYVNMEFCSLAVMSYDRYLAICCPLQYGSRMTPSRVQLFITVSWFYSLLKCFITLSLNVRLQLCGNVLHSLYCHNYLIVKLACSTSRLKNIYGLFNVVLSIMVPLVPIVWSYLKILQVCFSGNRQVRQKAVSTCSPHLVSLLNFSVSCFFEIVHSRFDMSSFPDWLRIVFTLFFMLQPLLSPVVFGLQMSKIRTMCRDLLVVKMSAAH